MHLTNKPFIFLLCLWNLQKHLHNRIPHGACACLNSFVCIIGLYPEQTGFNETSYRKNPVLCESNSLYETSWRYLICQTSFFYFFPNPGLVLNFPTIPGISRLHLFIYAFSQFPVTLMGVSCSWVDSNLWVFFIIMITWKPVFSVQVKCFYSALLA